MLTPKIISRDEGSDAFSDNRVALKRALAKANCGPMLRKTQKVEISAAQLFVNFGDLVGVVGDMELAFDAGTRILLEVRAQRLIL